MDSNFWGENLEVNKMRKNTANLGGVTMLFTHHRISEARVRSLLSLMFSAMLIMSNATPFVQVASAQPPVTFR